MLITRPSITIVHGTGLVMGNYFPIFRMSPLRHIPMKPMMIKIAIT